MKNSKMSRKIAKSSIFSKKLIVCKLTIVSQLSTSQLMMNYIYFSFAIQVFIKKLIKYLRFNRLDEEKTTKNTNERDYSDFCKIKSLSRSD